MRPGNTGQNSEKCTRRGFLAVLGGAAAVGLSSDGLVGELQAESPIPSSNNSSDGDEVNWASVRRQFLLEDGLAYFNNGSLGPCPRKVLEASAAAWRLLETDPVTQGYGHFIREMEEVRRKAADFLGCGMAEIAITRNTTDAMNTVAQGLELQRGQRVLTTDHEHPGGRVCWDYYAKRRGVIIDEVTLPVPPQSQEEIVQLFEQKLTKDTRVISVSHVTFSTGLRTPVGKIAKLAKDNGILLVVDGAQGPGAQVVDVKGLGCDTYATSAHKWMLAPKGTGLLYIAKEARKAVDPLVLQHGNRSYTASTGSRNIPTIIGLGAAIDFLNGLGKAQIEQRALSLRERVYEGIKAIPRLKLVSPQKGEMASPLVSFSLPDGVVNGPLARTLREKHRVVVKVVPRRLVNGFRVSTHLYNSEEEVEKLLRALRTELG